ncbi:Golgi transport complex subunit 4 [Globomyces sp. JEL0801]|nr:Golgi transport complex subunit 4 [Globomyces sp. JEL0801]
MLSIQQAKNLTDIEDIKKELELINDLETQLDDELESILNQKNSLKKTTIDLLQTARPDLGNLNKDTEELLQRVDNTWKIAQGMSEKVRQLDREQSRVKDCLKILDCIQDLKQCSSGAKEAIKVNDLPLACEYLRRYLQYDVTTVEAIYSKAVVVVETVNDDSLMGPSPLIDLRNSQMVVTDMLMDSFDSAIQNNQIDALPNLFKLFPLIGQHELGLDKFAAYMCGTVSQRVNISLKQTLESKNNRAYVDSLRVLFETIATVIDRQQSVVDHYYGPGSMLSVIVRLQREADIQSSMLLSSFMDVRKLERKVNEINAYTRNTAKNKTEPAIDPRELDVILGELAEICQKSHLFDRFIRLRASEDKEKLKDTDRFSKLNDVDIADTTKLNETIQALAIDTYDPDNLTSTCVDDVFYIVQSCIKRGIDTGDSDCFCALINSMGRILEVDYMDVLQKKLTSFFASRSDDSQISQLTSILNNIDKSCENILQLSEHVERNLSISFGHCSELSREQIKSCLSTMTDYASKFKHILKTWIENYFKQTIKPKIKTVLQNLLHDSKYVLNDEEFAYLEANDTFPRKFHQQFTRLVNPYEKSLTETNLAYILSLTLEQFTKEWEARLMQVKFNALGALKFDKECRNCISLLITHSSTARESFQRLQQIGLILSVEDVQDVLEYWGPKSGPIRWRLNASEVRKVLSLRYVM